MSKQSLWMMLRRKLPKNSFQAFCLECQSYVNAPREISFSSILNLGFCKLYLSLFDAWEGICYILAQEKKGTNSEGYRIWKMHPLAFWWAAVNKCLIHSTLIFCHRSVALDTSGVDGTAFPVFHLDNQIYRLLQLKALFYFLSNNL